MPRRPGCAPEVERLSQRRDRLRRLRRTRLVDELLHPPHVHVARRDNEAVRTGLPDHTATPDTRRKRER